MLEVYLSGKGKFKKEGWFACLMVESNSKTKRVFVPAINTRIKVRNYNIREVANAAAEIKEELTLWQKIKTKFTSLFSR